MARTIPEWIGSNDNAAIPGRVRLRVLDRQRPAVGELPICPDCGQPIRPGDGVEFDHETPLIDGGAHAESNLRAKHRKCHKLKTAREALERAESRRKTAKAYGIKQSRHPFPGSKASGWRKRMDGRVERR